MANDFRVFSFPGAGSTSGLFFGHTTELRALLEQYLHHHRIENHSPATIRDYKDELGAFLTFLESVQCPLEAVAVERHHVRSYLGHLQELGRAPTTINRAFGNVRAFFRWLVDEDILDVAPTAKIKAPKVPELIKPEISRLQVDWLLSLCPASTFIGSRRQAMFIVLKTSGMRARELSGLKVVDLDFEHDRIKVWGKGSKERHVPFEKEAQRAVGRWLRQREIDSRAVWTIPDGSPMAYGGIQKDLQRMFDRAFSGDLQDPCHIFRRTWALDMLRDGVDLNTLRILGGWESLDVILKHYAPLIESEDALEVYKNRKRRVL